MIFICLSVRILFAHPRTKDSVQLGLTTRFNRSQQMVYKSHKCLEVRKGENIKDYHGYRWSTVIGGAEVCKHLVCPTVRRRRGAVVQWRARSLSLALSQRSSGKQQQHKPNPCNRVSVSSTSVYSRVIQCPPLPAALSLISNFPPVLHLI